MTPEQHYNEALQKLTALERLLNATKMELQIVDDCITKLGHQRPGLVLSSEVSSEHRPYWCGAVDDQDQENGIRVLQTGVVPRVGWGNPFTGTIRNQSDANLVITRVLVARQRPSELRDRPIFVEGLNGPAFLEDGASTSYDFPNWYARLIDSNTGRQLVVGSTVTPFDRDRGAIPLGYLSSLRHGSGDNDKNALFSEFVLPRAATVKVELFNMGAIIEEESFQDARIFLALFGYKVYGA